MFIPCSGFIQNLKTFPSLPSFPKIKKKILIQFFLLQGKSLSTWFNCYPYQIQQLLQSISTRRTWVWSWGFARGLSSSSIVVIYIPVSMMRGSNLSWGISILGAFDISSSFPYLGVGPSSRASNISISIIITFTLWGSAFHKELR